MRGTWRTPFFFSIANIHLKSFMHKVATCTNTQFHYK